ncbi:MAG: GTP cyclohydrolase II [Neisseriaceae bacterium]|nr:GTP cyclohydrolase II [Neisseriaceae bacterium]
MTHTSLICTGHCRLPTEYGEFEMQGFDCGDGKEHIVLSIGDIADGKPVLVRIHSECLTGDAFHSKRCDCGAQLQSAMQIIQNEKRGLIIYLRQEGRGIGLFNKINAYHLQDQGMDTVEANLALGFPADARDFTIASQILNQMQVASVRLLTNNPDKIETLKQAGIKSIERVPLSVGICEDNRNYIATKANKMGHLIADNF